VDAAQPVAGAGHDRHAAVESNRHVVTFEERGIRDSGA
jgi:hypothetical protein